MTFRSKTISKLLSEKDARESYVRALLNQMIPSQIRGLRLRNEWTQGQLGDEAGMKQARISASESPGAVNFSLETLIRLAAAFRVGLQVRFVPYSEMLDWDRGFSQDEFHVTRIEDDHKFLLPRASEEQDALQGIGSTENIPAHALEISENYAATGLYSSGFGTQAASYGGGQEQWVS